MSETTHFVYYVQSGRRGLIKIGHSEDVVKRVLTLRNQSADPVNVLAVLVLSKEDALAHELTEHLAFASIRHHGEWFKPSKKLLRHIAENIIPLSSVVMVERAQAAMDETNGYSNAPRRKKKHRLNRKHVPVERPSYDALLPELTGLDEDTLTSQSGPFPPGPYTAAALAVLRHEARIMQMARLTVPAVAEAGQALLDACETHNYFTAAEAARAAIDATRRAFMPEIADTLERILATGDAKVAAPYLRAREGVA